MPQAARNGEEGGPALPPQYKFLAKLGRGSMGAVFLAQHTKLDRLVAIKLLPPADQFTYTGHAIERFQKEARLLAKMQHPGIVDVYDAGETDDGQLYIVMEFVEGTDLQEYIQTKGRVETQNALLIVSRVCAALQHAHSRGVIHRDIKPGNILINSSLSTIKIADFGIARSLAAGPGADQPGVVFGSPPYMAPEAYHRGVAVDARADVFSLGIVLYKMLTGQSPRSGALPAKIPGVSAPVTRIIHRATQPDRAQRHQTAAELRKEIDGVRFTRKKRE